MRTTFRFFGIALGILLAMPVWAQLESTQPQSTITQEQAPATPTLQDIRGPLNTISNRPRAATGTQPGAAPGARTLFPGSDLQQRIQEFQFQQLQEDLQAEQRERNEFQQFVTQSTGRDLPMFGANLFRSVPSTFAPVENVPVAADYVVGPGDEIQIRAWGQIDVDINAVVDRNGALSVPKVGTINVAGIKASDLPAYLKTVFGRTFRNFELTATLGKLRSIQIFVVGQAKRPGAYTVSSLSTLVSAVFAAGGPSSKGSMRNIQLKRGSQVVAEFDLYDLILSGDKSKDAKLLPGDVIYIAPVGQLVAVSGSVNVPAVYELRQSTVLFDLIRWAGGLATTAAGQKATVERIEDRKVRRVEEFALDMNGLSRAIRDGDLVTVYSLVPRFDNAVALRGNVAQPGRFPWHEGMRLRDLIPDKEALLSRDYWVKRNQVVGIEGTAAKLLSQQAQSETDAGRLAAIQPVKLLDQITPSVRDINWEYALIERIKREDLTTTLIPFNPGKAILEGDARQNLPLEPGDIVTIFSREDIKAPIGKQTQFIRLEGEFASSGVHQIVPGETLHQLVARVGGLSPDAYLFGAQLTRESTRVEQEKNLAEAINRLEREIQRATASRAQNIIAPEDADSLKHQAEAQAQLIARLREIRPTGRIVLELPETAGLKDIPELPLEDGDRFLVPSKPSMVNVFGSVYNENSFIYKPDKRFGDYLSQAGGPTRDADKSSMYVLRADGSVVSRRQSGFFSSIDGMRLMPGDSIVVPEEFDKTTLTRSLKDIAQIFYQFGLGAAAIKVLRQ
jgi:polysaccharide biosynthesis/export protein